MLPRSVRPERPWWTPAYSGAKRRLTESTTQKNQDPQSRLRSAILKVAYRKLLLVFPSPTAPLPRARPCLAGF